MSDSLQPHESQHTRPPYPSPTPRDYSNSCPSSRWCHPAISSYVIPFSSCPQSLPASGSFPMSQLFEWGGQSIGSFSFSISPSNEHLGLISFRMDWLDRLAVQGTLKSLLQHHSSKASLVTEKSSLNRKYSTINILESSTCYHYLQFRRGNIPRGQYLTKNRKAIKKKNFPLIHQGMFSSQICQLKLWRPRIRG